MHRRVLAALLLLPFAALACDSGSDSTATATSPAPTAPTAAATRPAGATGTAVPRVDGTVDPLGFGGTDPVTIKPNPDPPRQAALLRDVRVGAHPEEGGWDRIVFEFAGDLPPGEVSFIQQATSCGSGMNVPVQGQAILALRMTGVHAHNDAGMITIPSTRIAGPGNVILEARQFCDFEAHVDWAIGLKARNRFKVTRLSNPTRLVIDVKW